MDDEKKVIKEEKVEQVPERVTEYRTVEVPRTEMRQRTYERLIAGTCDELTGKKVVNPQGDDLGTISDIMLDIQSGRIAYAVLSFGSLFSKKLFAIPWEALSLEDPDRYYEGGGDRRFVLNISADKLKEEDGFDPDHYPRQPDRSWLSNVHSKYGYRSYWE